MAIRTAIQRSPEQGNERYKDDVERSQEPGLSDRSLNETELLKAFSSEKRDAAENAADPDKLFGFRCRLLSAARRTLESIQKINDRDQDQSAKQGSPRRESERRNILHAESLPDKGGSPDHGGQKQYQKILDWHLESCGFRTGRNDSCRQNCSF